MIVNLLINVVLLVFTGLFSFFDEVTLADIPYIGTSVSSFLVTIVGYWNTLESTLPYVTFLWHVFLFVILPFEGLLLLMKFFLGHRTPTNNA